MELIYLNIEFKRLTYIIEPRTPDDNFQFPLACHGEEAAARRVA